MGTRMLQRRGTTAEWTAANPVLGDGELGYDRTTGEVRVGDGVATWTALPSSKVHIPKATLDSLYVPLALVDAAGDLLVGSADNAIVRLGKGANGQILSVVGGVLTWVTPGYVTGSVKLTVATTAPASPAVNDLWVNST